MATLKTPAELDAYELNSAIKVNAQKQMIIFPALTFFLKKPH